MILISGEVSNAAENARILRNRAGPTAADIPKSALGRPKPPVRGCFWSSDRQKVRDFRWTAGDLDPFFGMRLANVGKCRVCGGSRGRRRGVAGRRRGGVDDLSLGDGARY